MCGSRKTEKELCDNGRNVFTASAKTTGAEVSYAARRTYESFKSVWCLDLAERACRRSLAQNTDSGFINTSRLQSKTSHVLDSEITLVSLYLPVLLRRRGCMKEV